MKTKFLWSVIFIICVFSTKAQVEISSDVTSTANAYILYVPGVFTLSPGIQITFKSTVACGSPVTMKVNTTLAKVIKKEGGATDLVSGDIKVGQVVNLVYDGTNWQMLSASGAATSSTAWGLLGNSGTVDGTNYIGTTDNIPLSFMVSGQKAGRIDQSNSNTFFGYLSGVSTTGSSNTAIGNQALNGNIGGNGNTSIGHQSMLSNSSGAANTATGLYALRGNTSGAFNSAFGYQTLWNNTLGGSNVAVGSLSMNSNTTAGDNLAIGYQALYSQSYGNNGAVWNSYNTAVGNGALYSTQSTSTSNGISNSALGWHTLYNNTVGNNNTANGGGALFSNITGSNATAMGTNAMYYSNNTATPFINSNVAIGYEALRGSITASANTGNFNTAVGYQTLVVNTSGSQNTATGYQALNSNADGTFNTATGMQVLFANSSGFENTASGWRAMQGNISGADNTATGWQALKNNNSGNNNTAIGASTLLTNTSGTYNTALGYNADVGSSNLFNATAIGKNAVVSLSNAMVLGGVGTDAVNVGIGTSSPNYMLHLHKTAAGVTNPYIHFTDAITGATTADGLIMGTNGAGEAYIINNETAYNLHIGTGSNNNLITLSTSTDYVGVGATSPSSLFSVGASSQFQVNSSGNIVKLNNVTTTFPAANGSGVLTNDGTGSLTWATLPSGASAWVTSGSNINNNTTYSHLGMNTTGIAPAATNMVEILQPSTTNASVALFASHTGSIVGTGYAGYFTKTGGSTTNVGGFFNASGATNNYAIIVPSGGGDVGIGTSAPLSRLDVVAGGTAGVRVQGFGTNGNGVMMENTDVATQDWFVQALGNSGTTGPAKGFAIADVTSATVPFKIEKAAPTNTLYLKSTGNVGIGTNTPPSLLTVHSTVSAQAVISTQGTGTASDVDLNLVTMNNATGSLAIGAAGTKGWILGARANAWSVAGEQNDFFISAFDGSVWNQIFNIDMVNKYVGIGTTIPLLKVDVRGSNAKTATAAFENIFDVASADAASPLKLQMGIKTDPTATNRYGGIEVDDAGVKRDLVLQGAGGNVGIGTTNPTELLSISSNTGGVVSQTIQSYNTLAFGNSLAFQKANGTAAAPTAVASGDDLGYIDFMGYNSANGSMQLAASIFAEASQAFTTAGYAGSRLVFSTAPLNTNTPTQRMTILNNGFVGINIVAPTAPLHVVGIAGATSFSATNRYFDVATAAAGGPLANLAAAAPVIRADGHIWSNGGAFVASSDQRIKINMGISNSQNDLFLVSQLKVTDYLFKDTVEKGNQIIKGFIAQDVENVVPGAVTKQTNWIPDIYQVAEKLEVNDQKKTVTIYLKSVTDLKVGDKIKLISTENYDIQRKVIAVNNNCFTVGDWNEKTDKLFVYGREVNDFRVVDYDRLFTLGISAIQELIKRDTKHQSEFEDLKKQFESQLDKNQKTESRLTQFEKENASLRSDLEKIKAQLGIDLEVKK